MSFRIDAPVLPLDAIVWDEIGDVEPKARLLGHFRIGNVDMHLEAWQVEDTEEGQVPLEHREKFEALCECEDCFAFQTLTIGDREYALFASPYGA